MFFIADATGVEYSQLLMQRLHTCTAIVPPQERVNCYDKWLKIPVTIESKTRVPSNEVAALPVTKQPPRLVTTTQTSKAQVIPDIKEIQQFGNKYLGPAQHQAAERKINLSLRAAKKNKYGKWTFYFANGQVWQQLEAKYISVPKNKPVVSTLSTGTLGSFDLRIGLSTRVIKVKRVE